MSSFNGPSDRDVDLYYQKVKEETESSGYILNNDIEFTKGLLRSILINKTRYGYGLCPCRLTSGQRNNDLDIICPCDYRDPDLNEYGVCYCALYISNEILSGKKKVQPIPERRPSSGDRGKIKEGIEVQISGLSKPVWRCKACGYICARDKPPEVCPICKVSGERFEKFI